MTVSETGLAPVHRPTATLADHRVLQIMIVEHGDDDTHLTADMLRAHHPALRLTTFDRVDDATRSLAGAPADCVLLDLGLPDAEGLDGLNQILAVAPGVPVVVLSGVDDDRLALDAVGRGAQDCVAKHDLAPIPLWRSINCAIERARLTSELTRRATQDALTGLPNAAVFHTRVDHAIARGRRSAAGFAVMLIELEDFKSINDNFGHAVGDEILIEISRRLVASLGEDDTPCRYAGVQFAALCQATDLPIDATRVATRIHEAISRDPVLVGVLSLKVGVSIGIALGSGREDAATLMHRVDGAIYEAKLTGAACVVD